MFLFQYYISMVVLFFIIFVSSKILNFYLRRCLDIFLLRFCLRLRLVAEVRHVNFRNADVGIG